MAKNNHHFVSQFYLRNFSKDGRSLCLINVPKKLPIPTASIREQCCRRKFYGRTNVLEDAFAELETQVGPIIKAIIDGHQVPKFGTEQNLYLFFFLALQLHKTRAAAENVARMSSLLFTHLAKKHLEHDIEDTSTSPVITNAGVALALSAAVYYAPAIADLETRVVRASRGGHFITSDHPVITYNQWCEGVRGGGVTGAACVGLQLFFPLSPDCLLMLFDPNVYEVDGREAGEVVLTDQRDINQLNRLQYIFAQENLFFSEWTDKDRILAALSMVSKTREDYKPTLNVLMPEKEDTQTEEEARILQQFNQMPEMRLKLRFSRVLRSARKVSLFERYPVYRYKNFPKLGVELPEHVEGLLQGKRFVVEATEAWKSKWGNLVP